MTEQPWKLPFLAAYPYIDTWSNAVLLRNAPHMDFFIDSGAFTAWTQKREIKLVDYQRFLDGLPVKPWHYLMLDVIGDPEATRRNFDEMRRNGFDPIPIVTRGDDAQAIEGYYETSEFVAFGGVSSVNNSSAAWCKAVMEIVGPRKAHLLGMTRTDWLKALKPFSVDSSSWTGPARFGGLAIYMGGGRMASFKPRTAGGPPPPDVCERIRRYGYDPYSLSKAENLRGGRGTAHRVSALSWVEFSYDCEINLGTKVFLVATCALYVDMLVWARNRILELRSRS